MIIAKFDINNLIEALDLTWKGMLTIFLGIAVIYFTIYVLTKFKDRNLK